MNEPQNFQAAARFDPQWRERLADGEKPAIVVRHVNHYYGTGEVRKQVLQDNCLEIYPGEIIIMTGPSGSGKTTLLTLIGTLRRVQEGELSVLGTSLHLASSTELMRLRREIGFIFQAHNLFDSLTALQNVRMSMELVSPDLTRREQSGRAAEMLAAVGLAERTGHKPKQLSGGQKQRVQFALAICGNPDLLFLDEPTVGLDVESRRGFWHEIRRLAARGRSIVLTTHYLEEADALADRVVIVRQGHIVADGTPAEVKSLTSAPSEGHVTTLEDAFLSLTAGGGR